MAQAEAEAASGRANTSGAAGPERGDETSKQKWKVLVGAGAVAVGSWFMYKRLTKKKTKEDHVEAVKRLLEGEKFCTSQLEGRVSTIRWSACDTGLKLDAAPVLYQEQTLANLPKHPYRQRFYVVKPTNTERKEQVVELAHHDVLNPEPLKNWCERPESDRSEITEHDVNNYVSSLFLTPCKRNEPCEYTGTNAPDGFSPLESDGKLRGLTHMTLSKGGGVNAWDRVVNAAEAKEHGKSGPAWGPHPGGYDFKPKKPEKTKEDDKKAEDKKPSYDLPDFTSRKPDLPISVSTQT